MARDEAIRRRFATMSTDALREALTTKCDDYVPRALELAAEELARRESGETSDPDTVEALSPPVRGAEPRIRIWDILLATNTAGAIVAVAWALVSGASFDTLVKLIAWGILIVTVYWLRATRARQS